MDPKLQPRTAVDPAVVEEYAARMKDGEDFPAIEVGFFDEKPYVLDGWHRVQAAAKLGKNAIGAIAKRYRTWDAMVAAVATANMTHGMRRTNADKRRSVMLLLETESGRQLTEREAARRCGVSHTLVQDIVAELAGKRNPQPAAEFDFDDMPDREESNAPVTRGERADNAPVADINPPAARPIEARMKVASGHLREIVSKINEIEQQITELSTNECMTYLVPQTLIGGLSAVRRAVKAGMPHIVCPHCGGEGCDECRMTGWKAKA